MKRSPAWSPERESLIFNAVQHQWFIIPNPHRISESQKPWNIPQLKCSDSRRIQNQISSPHPATAQIPAAATKKSLLFHTPDADNFLGPGAINPPIVLIMWRGVRNCPFGASPGCCQFESIYSYRSPFFIPDLPLSARSALPHSPANVVNQEDRILHVTSIGTLQEHLAQIPYMNGNVSSRVHLQHSFQGQ